MNAAAYSIIPSVGRFHHPVRDISSLFSLFAFAPTLALKNNRGGRKESSGDAAACTHHDDDVVP
eukprot:scaffold5931_cov120-Skeletonema_marinoi.AAC.2